MKSAEADPGLYGINGGNSNRSGKNLWGKNQFNSTFPLSLCLYMRDKGCRPIAIIERAGQIESDDQHWTMTDIIGTRDCRYLFEASFEPFRQYMRSNDELDKIDLVVASEDRLLRPLEVKLTVVPDNNTAAKEPDQWAPELVIRPVTSAYAMMSVAASVIDAMHSDPLLVRKMKSSLAESYNAISDWLNPTEIGLHADTLCGALDRAIREMERVDLQHPFLVQPIWRTVGQSFKLHEHCFDIFVWSDVAIMRLPLALRSGKASVRALREVARHVKALYEILTQGNYNYSAIYKGMPMGAQTDKSFALSGTKSIEFLAHRRLQRPLLPSIVLQSLVLEGGEDQLKPERRFDAAVQQNMAMLARVPKP